jgi:hypothetical protein
VHPVAPADLFAILPAQQQQRLQGALRPGEQLLWAGQPMAGVLFRAAFIAWLIALPILAACGYHLWQLSGQAIDVVDLLSILFCLLVIGVCIGFLGLPWRMRRGARYTVYAVTDARALTLEGVRAATVRTFARTRGPDFHCAEGRDGSGDLVLERDTSVDSEGSERSTEAGFFAIADVARVAALFLP